MFAVRFTVPEFLPDVGLAVSQGWVSRTLHESVPPPVLETAKLWAAGFAPSAVALKETDVLLRPIAGGTGAAATVSVTATVLEVVPVAETITVAL